MGITVSSHLAESQSLDSQVITTDCHLAVSSVLETILSGETLRYPVMGLVSILINGPINDSL